MQENKHLRPQSQSARRPAGSAAGAAMNITPKEIIGILRRHIFLIISLTIVGAFIGGSAWFVMRIYAPKYTARTFIEVLSPGQSDPSVIGTRLANKDIAYEFRFSKAALIKQQSMMQELIKRDVIRETKWFKKFNNDVLKTIENLDKRFGAVADRNSNYIRISMTCGSAVESALIVNQMTDLFIKTQRTTAEAGVSQKLRQLNQQKNDFRDNLRSLNNSLTDIRRTSGITQLEHASEDNFRHTVTQKLANLEIDKLKLEADIEQVRTSVKNYEERSITDDIIERSTENDTVIISLIQKITNINSELARKQTNLGENHREIKQLKELLRQTISEKDTRSNLKAQQIKQSDLTTIKDQFAVMTNRLAKLEELRSQTEKEQRELDNTVAAYAQFTTEREEAKANLFAVQEQISKYNQIKEDAESAKVRPVGLAPAPLRMSSPKLLVYGPGGTFLGLFLGLGLAFLIELMNELLRTPSDVMKYLNIPLLGMITHKNLNDDTKNADMWHVVSQSPYSMMSECYRQFKTNLKLSTNLDAQQVIFITSGTAEEGRTTVAVNTAVTFAAEDQRVLLIDANFRRPTSLEIFPLAGTGESADENMDCGLSGYLLGKCSTEQLIRATGMAGTDIIDSGKLPENPAELLGGNKMAALIEYAKNHYDRIIIDGPPMLVSDAKALASQADGTIVVFNTAITKRGAAKRIVRELGEVNTYILGAVLIGVRILKGGYFRELFDSYQQYQEANTAAATK